VKVIDELIGFIAGRTGLKDIREFAELLTKRGRKGENDTSGSSTKETVKELLDVIGSDLLEFGQWIIATMKITTGEGDPEKGESFGHGQRQFNRVDGTLESAVPNDSWDGSGSRAYADQNSRQRLRSVTMADADHEVHRLLFKEAAQIKLRRDNLDDASNFLAKTSYVTFPLQFIPRYGEAAKLVIELSALRAALTESSIQLYELHSEINENAAQLQQTVGRYSGVADGAEPPGSGSYFSPAPKPRHDGSTHAPGENPSQNDGPPGGPGGPAGPGVPPMSPPAGTGSAAAPGAAGSDVSGGPLDQAPPGMPGLPQMPTLPGTPALGAGAAGGALGSLMAPLGGLLTGATQAAGQRAASPGQPAAPSSPVAKNAKKKADDAGAPADEKDREADEDTDDMDAEETTAGDGRSERAPVHIAVDADPGQLHAPGTARLVPHEPSAPAAVTAPQRDST
jgi:EspA/EspE family